MFEKFTEKAIKVIMLAQEEARRLGHNRVGTEFILLGLIGEGTGIAAKTLKSMNVNLKNARIEVEKMVGRGPGFVAVEIPFTPSAKRMVELSWDEARRLGHNFIDTAHLLLGLLRESEHAESTEKAGKVLTELHVDLTKLRAATIDALKKAIADGYPGDAPARAIAEGIAYPQPKSKVEQSSGTTIRAALELTLGALRSTKEMAIREQEFELAAWLREREMELSNKVRELSLSSNEPEEVEPARLGLFDRFTEKSIKVIMLAGEESQRLGHNFVGTEQILLGLIAEGTGIAGKTLKSFRVNLQEVRVEVEKIIGRGSGFVALGIPFTPRAKRVLELSWDEARQLGHHYLGTEHLLLGLLREGDGVAVRVLSNLGLNLAEIRIKIVKLLGESGIH